MRLMRTQTNTKLRKHEQNKKLNKKIEIIKKNQTNFGDEDSKIIK